MHTEEKLDIIAQEGYDFKLGEYIGLGWNIFAKYPSGFIGYGIIAGLIFIITGILPFIGSIASIFLSPALIAGVFIVAHKIDTDGHAEFADFWKGFDKILDLGLASFIGGLIVLASLIPFGVAVAVPIMSNFDVLDTDPSQFFSIFPFWAFVLIIPAIFLGVAFSWSTLFVVFDDLDFWKALNYSRKIITKNWLGVFAFSIIIGILAGMGAIVFFIGLLVTIPFAYCATYAAFADVTDLDNAEEFSLVDELIV